MKRTFASTVLIVALLSATVSVGAAAPDPNIGINVVLNAGITDARLADLGQHGRVLDVVVQIDALTMLVKSSELAAIQALPYVTAATPDGQASYGPS